MEFCKYVRRRKGNRENILVIKDQNGKLITDTNKKASSLNSYYASLFSCECNITKFNQQNQVNPSPLVLTL